jgi:hypothetical protein
MDTGRFKSSLGEPWGCNLISIVFLAFIIGYGIYGFATGGGPQNKKFFDDCYRRETRQYLPGDTPDHAMRQAIAECTNQQNRALGLPDTHMRALS